MDTLILSLLVSMGISTFTSNDNRSFVYLRCVLLMDLFIWAPGGNQWLTHPEVGFEVTFFLVSVSWLFSVFSNYIYG
jgi:hypothetical protein